MIFKQIPIGSMANFAYIFGCDKTGDGALVDPAFDINKLLAESKKAGLTIRYIFTTHTHFDHIGGHGEIISQTAAKAVVHKLESSALKKKGISNIIEVEDNDIIQVGNIEAKIIHTPGHTPGGICILLNNEKLITGDTLFIGDCGRTDLAGGSSRQLYESIEKKIKTLHDSIEIYPGHGYGRKNYSTVREQKKSNPALMCKSLEEFEALP
ncbi:MAG: MBL fold metallo-hydrolase [Candidatus Schekmanbacteria bacterium]|nr:MBL fold metallo-hydrolase [Candidatus Schekmanbacteria bacterium]